MAGDWIKIKTDLATDPAVIGIASRLGLEEDLVVGKLCRLWAWANTHTENGHAGSVTPDWLDKFLGVTAFAEALSDVGWLEVVDDGLEIPRFDRHNGKSAKTRATARERKRREREVSRNRRDNGHAPGVTETGHVFDREEKRRELNHPPPNPPDAIVAAQADSPPCPGAWAGVEGALIQLGVFAPRQAIEGARDGGATPEDVRAVLEVYQSQPGAWGPGAIRNRVLICRPALDPAEGWPATSPDYDRQRQADSEGEKRKERQAEQAREDARRAEAKRAAVQQEQTWGPVLDQLKPDELDQLADSVLGQTGPAVTHYRRRGATGMVRGLLLAAMAGHGYEGAEA